MNGQRINGRGRETSAAVSTLLFDPTRNSTKGWLFLIPKSVLNRPAGTGEKLSEEDVEQHRLQVERWSKAITVYSISHAIAITKLVWHKLFTRAEDLLSERDSIAAHDTEDQQVAFWNNWAIDNIWLLNLGLIYFSAYSQYFSEKGVEPATSELAKYEDLIIIDKGQTEGCREESLFVSGANIMGCSVSKALKLNASSWRRLESIIETGGSMSMQQRWLRHGENKNGDEVRKQLIHDFPCLLRQERVCPELGKTIRENGHCPLAFAAERRQPS